MGDGGILKMNKGYMTVVIGVALERRTHSVIERLEEDLRRLEEVLKDLKEDHQELKQSSERK